MQKKGLLFILILISAASFGQQLGRRASWGARIAAPAGNPGAKVISVEANSALEKAGIVPGDLILQVDGRLAGDDDAWTSITYALRAEQPVELLVRRNAGTFKKKVSLPALPKETHAGLEVYYESVVSDYGLAQRTIITRPQNKNGRQPALFIVQGLSCSAVETFAGREDNWAKMLNSLVENTGMVVMRVEKPGVGDSEGDCACTDFETEMSGYRAALRSLKSKSYVDTTRIVIYGASMGSAIAPALANEFGLAGVVSDGTFFKTWFEHMLEIERRIRGMEGDDESTIARKMNEVFIPLYYGMLIRKKSYGEIVDEYPAIKAQVYHGREHMYGRPVAYYQQLQDFDFAGAWEKINVPVRILYGEFDWIMSAFDNQMIMQVLDKRGHQDHKLHIYPGMDHWNTIHSSPLNSYRGEKGTWDPQMPALVVSWIREMAKLPAN